MRQNACGSVLFDMGKMPQHLQFKNSHPIKLLSNPSDGLLTLDWHTRLETKQKPGQELCLFCGLWQGQLQAPVPCRLNTHIASHAAQV